MAIAEMRKISIVAEPESKEAILRDIQTLQNVEVRDLPTELAEEELALQPGRSEAYAEHFSWYERAEAALKVLSQYRQKQSLKAKLTAKRPTMTMAELYQKNDQRKAEELIERVESLKKRRTAIQDEREAIETQQDDLINWRNLPVDPTTFNSFEFFIAKLGKLPNDDYRSYWNALKEVDGLSISEVYSNEDEIGVVIFIDPDEADAVEKQLTANHFDEWVYEYNASPEVSFNQLETKRKDLVTEEKEVVASLQEMQSSVPTIGLASEVFYNQAQLNTAEDLTFDNSVLSVISGWIPEEEYATIQSVVANDYDKQAVLLTEDITEEEIADNKVPIKLKNNKLVEPFELVTEMYNLPKYSEVDPTPFLAPFYILFFGMMVADLGYGILIWIASLLALKIMDLKSGGRRFMTFGHILSYPTMIWGLIYGTFFGESLPIKLIDPTADVEMVLLLSIGFGFIQIILGLFIKAYLASRHKDYDSVYSDGLGWVFLLTGLVIMIIGMMVMHNDLVTAIGKWTAIIAAVGMLIIPMFFKDNKLMAVGGGLYNLYGITNYVGDFVSYTRLMALGISGGSIALSFNMLVAFFPAPARFTIGVVLLIFLHLFNMFLSLLSAYVHGARLIFVEFFGKFYEGGGRAFAPIKTLQNHIRLKDNK